MKWNSLAITSPRRWIEFPLRSATEAIAFWWNTPFRSEFLFSLFENSIIKWAVNLIGSLMLCGARVIINMKIDKEMSLLRISRTSHGIFHCCFSSSTLSSHFQLYNIPAVIPRWLMNINSAACSCSGLFLHSTALFWRISKNASRCGSFNLQLVTLRLGWLSKWVSRKSHVLVGSCKIQKAEELFYFIPTIIYF
jgi:hypothetical protein